MIKKYRREKNLQEAVKKAIKLRYGTNVWYYHPREAAGGRKAIMDNILCCWGIFVAIEVKRDLENKGLTRLQKHNMDLVKRAGGFTIEADTVDQVMRGLKYIVENTPHILKQLKGADYARSRNNR